MVTYSKVCEFFDGSNRYCISVLRKEICNINFLSKKFGWMKVQGLSFKVSPFLCHLHSISYSGDCFVYPLRCPSVRPSICLFVCSPVRLSVYLSICHLSACTSLWLSEDAFELTCKIRSKTSSCICSWFLKCKRIIVLRFTFIVSMNFFLLKTGLVRKVIWLITWRKFNF